MYFAERKIPYLNYFDAYNWDSRFQNIHIWRDAYHMNQNGARLLSTHIKKDLKLL
jgi:hypothetical protein